MMIQYLQIENFKSLKKFALPLQNLNLFFGMNGMGKSSVIQALLLLRQSFWGNYKSNLDYLYTNGDLIRLGTGKDIFCQSASDNKIRFYIQFNKNHYYDCRYMYDLNDFDCNQLARTENGFNEDYATALFSEDFSYLSAEHLNHITTCRIAPKDNTKLFQMICALPDSVNVKNFYFSFFRSPYESETVEEKQDDYYTYNWTCHGKECIGIALAFLLDSICFSIYSQNWNSPFIDFFQNETSVCVRNISIKEHVDIHLSQMQTQTGAELPECDIPVSDKKIVLRKDYGMDVLEAFCKRLIHSPYLIGVVNSLPYNPHERKFIRKVRENGLIEIVLPWTDEGYGIVVKTTGRTIRETKRISEIITEEFGYL